MMDRLQCLPNHIQTTVPCWRQQQMESVVRKAGHRKRTRRECTGKERNHHRFPCRPNCSRAPRNYSAPNHGKSNGNGGQSHQTNIRLPWKHMRRRPVIECGTQHAKCTSIIPLFEHRHQLARLVLSTPTHTHYRQSRATVCCRPICQWLALRVCLLCPHHQQDRPQLPFAS